MASRKSRKKASGSSRRLKTKRIVVRFDPEKAWIYQDLLKLVNMKTNIGFPTTLALEVARIVEDYLTGVITGKETDAEFLLRSKNEFIRCE